jgi:hypothetical protein
MSIKQHFRTYGFIHTFWIISLLLCTIAALIMTVPNGNVIRDYLSFASAISSIILAVIAIFFSMFSNQSFSEIAGSLKDSIDRTDRSSREIGDTSSTLAALGSGLVDQSQKMTVAARAMADKKTVGHLS